MNDLCVDPNTVAGVCLCIFYVLIRSVEHEKHKQGAIISTSITSDGLYDSCSVLQGVVGLKWLYYSYNMSANCFFAAGILPVFCLYSAGICTKNVYYINAYALTLFCTYIHYRTRFLLISRMCICTSQDNDTHVFVRFLHWKNQLYMDEFF